MLFKMTQGSYHTRFRFWLATCAAVVVHLVFVLQLLAALPKHGLVLHAFGVFFFPHMMLMYCLPPAFDWSSQGTDWWGIVGKIIDAAPASLLYGFAVQAFVGQLRKVWKKKHVA
jgi:hypothetical protein